MIERAVHLICEDFRSEERKKLTLLGVFSGETVLLGPSPPGLPEGVKARLSSLCVVSTLFTHPGTYTVQTKLVEPKEGKTIHKHTYEIAVDQDSATLITKIVPFEVRSLGEYTMHYALGNSEIQFRFKIMFAPSELAAKT